MGARRWLLAMWLGTGVIFGYGSAIGSLVAWHGGHAASFGHGCPHARDAAPEPSAAQTPTAQSE